MVRAISWLDEYEDWQSVLVLCDSKSLVETLANSNQPDCDVQRIQSAIAELCKKKEVRILWVPGHCNLHGNELADLEAKLGSEVAQPSVPMDSSTRAALIRREERQSSLTHPRLTALYTTRLREEEEAFLQKADRTDLIWFRCGHHPHLRRWQHMTGMSETDNCRLRRGRRVVWASMAPMPCLHRGASTPRPGEDLWWACAPPMRIASAAENHLQAPAVTPTTTTTMTTLSRLVPLYVLRDDLLSYPSGHKQTQVAGERSYGQCMCNVAPLPLWCSFQTFIPWLHFDD